ncbi:hypothetical protein GJ699_25460 [Duganella sp. FT80W]|uniref:Lipoprotein n=1 Tax=Duganella guangzhouensis TaxID=2666084 RepID=A0A6I2L593_9BURK|nr:hypothetical protein [Duganella guangzhouensis]MRW93341.1 hypothetical protein [Duganella guangzhouensis]
MKTSFLLCGVVGVLTGCASAGEFIGRAAVELPHATDTLQRELQQNGTQQQRSSADVRLPGVR